MSNQHSPLLDLNKLQNSNYQYENQHNHNSENIQNEVRRSRTERLRQLDNTYNSNREQESRKAKRKSNAHLAVEAVQQEIDAVRALKRLSMGGSLPLDPDLSMEHELQVQIAKQQRRRSSSSSSVSSNEDEEHTLIDDSASTEQSRSINAEKLLWVPAKAHPSLAPDQFRRHVQLTLNDFNNKKSPEISQESKSLPSLQELTDELDKLSEMAGLTATDAVTLARSLSSASSSSSLLYGETDPSNESQASSNESTERLSENLVDQDSPLFTESSSLKRNQWATYSRSRRSGKKEGIRSRQVSPLLDSLSSFNDGNATESFSSSSSTLKYQNDTSIYPETNSTQIDMKQRSVSEPKQRTTTTDYSTYKSDNDSAILPTSSSSLLAQSQQKPKTNHSRNRHAGSLISLESDGSNSNSTKNLNSQPIMDQQNNNEVQQYEKSRHLDNRRHGKLDYHHKHRTRTDHEQQYRNQNTIKHYPSQQFEHHQTNNYHQIHQNQKSNKIQSFSNSRPSNRRAPHLSIKTPSNSANSATSSPLSLTSPIQASSKSKLSSPIQLTTSKSPIVYQDQFSNKSPTTPSMSSPSSPSSPSSSHTTGSISTESITLADSTGSNKSNKKSKEFLNIFKKKRSSLKLSDVENKNNFQESQDNQIHTQEYPSDLPEKRSLSSSIFSKSKKDSEKQKSLQSSFKITSKNPDQNHRINDPLAEISNSTSQDLPSSVHDHHQDQNKENQRSTTTPIPPEENQATQQHRLQKESLEKKLSIENFKKSSKPNAPLEFTDSAFGFPLPPLSSSTLVMLDHRFPIHVERALYRLSHLKLANPKRPLRQQVLLSNFMYAYLNLVNHTLYLQQLSEDNGDEVPLSAI